MALEMKPKSASKPFVVFNRTSDLCQYFKRKRGQDFVLKVVYDILSQHGSFSQKCPIKKGHYFFRNFTFEEEMIPPFIPLSDGTTTIFTMKYYTKVNREFVTLVTSSFPSIIRVL